MPGPAPDRSRSARAGFLLAVAAVLLLTGGVLLRAGLPALLDARRAAAFPALPAVVVSSTLEPRSGEHGAVYAASVTLRYQVGSAEHVASAPLRAATATPSRDEAESWRPSPGSNLRVRVNPDNPADVRLDDAPPMRAALAAGWALPCLALGLVAGVFAAGVLGNRHPIAPTHAPLGPLGVPAGGLALSGATLVGWSRAVTTGAWPATLDATLLLWAGLAACWMPAAWALRHERPWRWL